MKTKKESTLVQRACTEVSGFAAVWKKYENQVALKSLSQSSLNNYGRKLAHLCLHFGCLPELLSNEQIESYLAERSKNAVTPSLSDFKHSVYGLRFYFRSIGQKQRTVSLPSLRKERRLPSVLGREECKRIFLAPDLLKHRVALMLIYSAGLRANELCSLRISDIDSERMSIHIRMGKGKKDRYVPLSAYILEGLRKYFLQEKPQGYLFNGKQHGECYSVKGLQWILRQALKKAKIHKEGVCLHTLRHSYATHLLEEGLDIISIKELLGHSRIETTMMYLHVAHFERKKVYSPLDTLYGKRP